MSATTDKVKGAANEAVGKAKEKIGEATGNERLEGEGTIQEVKGKGQQALGDAKQATKDAVNRAGRRSEQEALISLNIRVGRDRPSRPVFSLSMHGGDPSHRD